MLASRLLTTFVVLVLAGTPNVIAGGINPSSLLQTTRASEAEAKAFREWMDLIVKEDWTGAAGKLENFIQAYPKSRDAGAAFYWLAFVQNKQGQFQRAEQTLVRLMAEFPNSPWANDARALRVGVAASLGNSALVAEAARDAANGEAQIVALEILSRRDSAQAVDILAGLVNSDSKVAGSLKEAAIDLLARSDSSQAVSVLTEVARKEANTQVRKRAIFSLGQSRDESIVDLLAGIARENAETEVGNAALFALSQHKSERAVSVLAEISKNSQSPETRNRVMLWLSSRAGDGAVEELEKLYRTATDVASKRQALVGLFRQGRARADAALFKIARSDENAEMRKEAIGWLGRREKEEVFNELVSLFDDEKSDDVKEKLLMTFAQSTDDGALKKLADVALSDASARLRSRAKFWLTRSANPKAAKFLEGLPR